MAKVDNGATISDSENLIDYVNGEEKWEGSGDFETSEVVIGSAIAGVGEIDSGDVSPHPYNHIEVGGSPISSPTTGEQENDETDDEQENDETEDEQENDETEDEIEISETDNEKENGETEDEIEIEDDFEVDESEMVASLEQITLEERKQLNLNEEASEAASDISPVATKKKITTKLQWNPKPSVPAYTLTSAKKLNVDTVGKTVITTKGKAAKLTQAKAEAAVLKSKLEKQRFREEIKDKKDLDKANRNAIVSAEKARVAAAKKAKLEATERIRAEAALRRKQEQENKLIALEEFENKKRAINKARVDAIIASKKK